MLNYLNFKHCAYITMDRIKVHIYYREITYHELMKPGTQMHILSKL